MNYYPFHIGDYLSATRHLSWEEDAAYRRLLDTYYTTEKAIPAELRAACRLVLATTESQREAVQQVLTEFFELTPDGWVNHRADSEIESMRDKQSMSENRDLHEKERMRRHRERRAEMFSSLREVGIVPAWDVPIKELQRLHNQHCNAPATTDATTTTEPATHLQREQVVFVNAPATAIPTPTPTPTPTPVLKNTSAVAPPAGVDLSVWSDFVDLRKSKKAKLTQTAVDGIQAEASKAGWTLENALRECCSRGWTGFKASWVADKPQAERPAQQLSFAERDRIAGMQRWEEGCNQRHPDLPPEFSKFANASSVIDITPNELRISQ